MLGERSKLLYNRLVRLAIDYPDCGLRLEAERIRLGAVLDRFLSRDELDELVDFLALQTTYQAEYKTGDYIPMDVYHAHHGLRYLSTQAIAKLRGTVFVDGGAYVGDSALMFVRHYDPAKVISFDISPANLKAYKALMRAHGVSASRFQAVHAGLGERPGFVHANIPQFPSDTAGITEDDAGTGTRITSLDQWLEENPQAADIGLIKYDLEGFGLEALRGSVDTITGHRPLLLLGVYHNPKEFFEIPPFVKNITQGLDYKYAFARLYTGYQQLREVFFIAIPH